MVFSAVKWGVSSKIGTYFDVTTDFVFVFSLFVAWMLKGFCPIWVLIVLAVIFGQFIVTNFLRRRNLRPSRKIFRKPSIRGCRSEVYNFRAAIL